MSFLETLVILLVAIVVFGPKRLPSVARKVGHWMGVLRRASDEFKQQLMAMDQHLEQRVTDSVNASTGELDRLLPTDEELGAAFDPNAPLPSAAPPPFSPDDALEQPPVPGGLSAIATPAAPSASPAAPEPPSAAEATPSERAPQAPEPAAAPDPTPEAARAPRSLGLSSTAPALESK